MLNYVLRSPMTWWSVGITSLVFGIVMIAKTFSLPAFVDTALLALLFLAMALSMLGILFDIAPPSVTRLEVAWANRNAGVLYTVPVVFEEEKALPPILNRVVAHSDDGGKRHRLRSSELSALRASVRGVSPFVA
ncbi:hypothetical protein [Rhizobium sp. AB2/73]|uniref:hypothetical protein n=1 Tax=Rhizobium sp. AB2/73 TaxID=2795216 RepID=UPI000DDF4D4D|nr:hypothetical protein [Rhizobium sp. AB2/73]QYA17514.1 hypothetical protein J5284_34190 [Rhizobium sp. AB2/73]UEQ85835.1 hypothetical protein I8E17_34170 [Rhizobium sp. AB2/73]